MHTLKAIVFAFAALFAAAKAQDVRITEFQATNTTGIVDEDLARSPWIEIWNPNPATTTSPFGAITLTGWKLTNGTSTWTFPAVQILPDERIIVWASGKNRAVVTAQLHTNFTIPAGGGTLQLLRTDNSLASSMSGYPAQTANTSWGRDEVDSGVTAALVGRYTTPTPGERNNYLGVGVAGKVAFDKTSQAFSGSIIVTLSQVIPDAAAVIRYTTNGTLPTVTSTQYTAPITVASTQMLRARVFKSALLPGETETHCYLLLDSTTTGFVTTMQLAVITNFGAGTPPDTGDQNAFLWVWQPSAVDQLTHFTELPAFASRIVIDRRGSSTLNNAKHNVNLEARNAYDDDDRNVSLMGMAPGSDYVFSGPFDFDRSLIHNPFMYALSRSIGRYAPDARLAEVFFDVNGGSLSAPGTNTLDYFGIYNVMEKIRRDKDRVAISKLDVYDNGTVAQTGGYIFKVDRLDTGDTGFTAGGQTMAYYYPKELALRTPQRSPQIAYLSSAINTMNTALQSGTWNNPTTGYAAYLDVPGAIDHHLLNVWPMNVDALRLSGYWYKERGGKLTPGPIWDFDRTMESADARDDNPVSWRSTVSDFGTDFFNFTWWNRLFLDIDFYQKYIDRWQVLRRGPLSQSTVNALLDSLNNSMSGAALARDVARWGKAKRTNTFPSSPSPSYPGTQAGEIQRIKEWLQVRANFMDSQWVAPVTASVAEGNVSPNTSVTLSGPAGATIYYTLNGAEPRPSGGGAPSGVLTYTGTPITIASTTRIRARAYNPSFSALTGANNPALVSKWSGLTNPRYSTDTVAVAGSLVVTEVNYHPANPTASELLVNPTFSDSDFEFLELRNNGATTLDLGGVQIAVGITFTFSGDNAISLPPGGYVIVAANPSAFIARHGSSAPIVGPWSGDLSNTGEQLILKATSGATILDFTYSNTWYPATDGSGRTLAIYDPYAQSAAFSTAANWRTSAAIGGSPGSSEPNLAPILNAGADLVGIVSGVALVGTGKDDSQPNPPRTLTIGWSMVDGPGSATFAQPGALSTNVTFSLPGIYSLRLTVDDSAMMSADELIVIAKDTPAAWLARYPSIGTLDSDFDGDGRSNFVEFALGTNPTIPDPAASPTTTLENGHLTLTYVRTKPPSAVVYSIEVADDSVAFRAANPGEVTEQILTDDDFLQTVKVTDTVTTNGQSARFIRLKVSPAP